MNVKELIEKIEALPAHNARNRPWIDKKLVLGLVRELDEPQSIKLKDVIARIKGFKVGTRKIWIDEILNELGSDYGVLKYKAGYEQGKLEGEWVGNQLKNADKIRQELDKPVIPQFVADWIEESKQSCKNVVEFFKYKYKNIEMIKWIESEKRYDLIARAWLDGYEVEKEKRYLVKIKGISEDSDCLNYDSIDDEWYLASDIDGCNVRPHHTRKELEQAGFGWVFDCPGIEVEEVEDE